MTGFGEASDRCSVAEVRVEIRSVNSRFLDVSCRMPQQYVRYERELIGRAKNILQRGQVEIFVKLYATSASEGVPVFSAKQFDALAEIYRDAYMRLGAGAQFDPSAVVSTLLGRREVLDYAVQASDPEEEGPLVDCIRECLTHALAGLCSMRRAEGASLEVELRRLLCELGAALGVIEAESDQVSVMLRDRLQERIALLLEGVEIDAQRLAQEAAFLADKADITEEVARIKSHIAQFSEALDSGSGGRRLEFILQEFVREFNTIGSKTPRSAISAQVIEAKSLLEKLKEQVLNVE